MKKLFLTCAAVVGISAVFAANAFAADPTVNDAGFDKEKGTYSVAADLSNQTGQMTILIIPESIYTSNATIEDKDIYYIDQTAAGAGIFQNVGILGGTTLKENTSYIVKIGGENIAESGIIVEKFTVAKTETGREIQLGECDGITVAVDAGDAMAVLEHFAGRTTLTGDALIAAECDGIDAAIDAGDAMAILEHFAGRRVLGKITVK